MAVDEALLLSAAENNPPCLRFYQWAEPTVSLGYFQRYADRFGHAASAQCALVRRATGGGAIVHDVELTYSFTCHVAARTSRDTRALYRSFHETLVAALAAHGVAARLCTNPAARENSFLCFQRRTEGDVLLGSFKIAGSAQRRNKGGIVQHGSVLLAASAAAPELPGIRELAPGNVAVDSLIESWKSAISCRLGLSLEPSTLVTRETTLAATIEAEKFAHESWSQKR